jgi:hypothetical protein
LRRTVAVRQTKNVRLVALVLPLVALAGGMGVASASPERQSQTALRLVDVAPVTFRGTGFESGESVRVTLSRQRNSLVRNVQAGAMGAFTAKFGWVAVDVCRGAVVVTATGAQGSRATYKRLCRPPDPVP